MNPDFQMSEADTPNPQSPDTPLLSDAENQSSPQEIKLMNEADDIEVSDSPILKDDTSEPQPTNVVELSFPFPETSSSPEPELTVIEGIAADPSQNLDFGKDADWFTQARKQRQRNRELIKQVAQLEQALAESQEAVQTQSIRTKSADTLITQQAEELYSTKEQVTRLFKELESAYETTQRQQLLIQTLSEQLETAQQRVTQLEQQERFLQKQEQQQSQRLRQVENTCEELRDRLRYEQRQTQQFKAALKKSGETANTPLLLEIPASPEPMKASTESPSAPIQASKVKSIQPWSSRWDVSQAQEEDSKPAWANKSISSPEPVSEPATQPSSVPWEDSSTQENEGDPMQPPLPTVQPLSILSPELNREAPPQPVAEPIAPRTQTPSPSPEEVFFASQTNYPSPTIYPLRSTKKRKSLAAIDLPSFPRYN